jgi:hypothetical protein
MGGEGRGGMGMKGREEEREGVGAAWELHW